MPFVDSKAAFQVMISLSLVGYGFYIILTSSFLQPSNGLLDMGLMKHIAIGIAYAFSGIWILVERPEFSKAGFVLFGIFMLEMSRIGTY